MLPKIAGKHLRVLFFYLLTLWLHMLRKYYIILLQYYKERIMKQSKLLKEMYQASLSHDDTMIQRLRKLEFEKIVNRKAKGKPFTSKWTVADGL